MSTLKLREKKVKNVPIARGHLHGVLQEGVGNFRSVESIGPPARSLNQQYSDRSRR